MKKQLLKGYAIIDKNDNDVMYSDYEMTEKEMRCWYRNQLEEGHKLAKITVEIINEKTTNNS